MKILFLSRWYPHPADNGARLRILNLIKVLAQSHEVSLVSFTSDPVSNERMRTMRTMCVNVQTAPHVTFQPESMKALIGAVSPKPRSVVSMESAQMHALVRAEAQRMKPDLVISSQIDMLAYADDVGSRRMIDELEVGIVRQAYEEASGAGKLRAWMTWQKLRSWLRMISRAFHGCTMVSENELRLAKPMLGDMPLAIVPNGVDVAACSAVRAAPAPNTLIYNGSLTYAPNLDAVQYFVRDIFPLVLCERPAARLFVTGRTDGVPADQLPRHDNLVYTGYVDDIRQSVAGSWLAAVPLRRGGGTRLKILESMALRTPVVCTSKGAEGLGLVNGVDALIADDPQTFARHVITVLSDIKVRMALAERGAQTVAMRFDWQVLGKGMLQFARLVAGGGK
jgi:glycosyltransferase involved in cell wall biosynthesis